MVNGSIKEQIQNLKDLAIQKAESLQLDNRIEYNKATDYMNNSQYYNLYQKSRYENLNDNFNDDFQKVQAVLNNIFGVHAVAGGDIRNGDIETYSISIDVDGKEAEETIAKIYKEIESLNDI